MPLYVVHECADTSSIGLLGYMTGPKTVGKLKIYVSNSEVHPC